MSYSFSIRADTKDEATRQIREQFDAIVEQQPGHVKDREAAVVAAQILVRLLNDPDEHEEIYVNMHGSLGWKHHDNPNEFTSANVSINVMLRMRKKE